MCWKFYSNLLSLDCYLRKKKVPFYAPQLCRDALLKRVLAMGILSVSPSVCLSATTRYGFNARWDRDSGSLPYDSLESLVSYEVIWCQRGSRFPLNEGIKEGHPLRIRYLPLLAHLAWKRLQIDTHLLLIIASTVDELSSGTNIDDLERPWTPKLGVCSEFSVIFGCNTYFKNELRRNHSRYTRTTCVWNVRH